MSQNVILTAGTLPSGYCFTSLQQYYNDIIALTLAQLPGTNTSFNFGPNLPDVADQDKPWIRTDSNGYFDRLYTFLGEWLSPHPVPANSKERRLWVGTTTELGVYDGGDGGAVITDTTGPMWAVDTNFDLKFPYGADGNTINVNDTGGSSSASISSHTHVFGKSAISDTSNAFITQGDTAAGGTYSTIILHGNSNTTGSLTTGDMVTAPAGDATAATLPPYKAVYFIKRTARVFYKVT